MLSQKTFVLLSFWELKNLTMKLSDLKIGEKSVVSSFADSKIGSKLMTMGMIPGSLVELVRKASAGRTLYIKVNGYGMAVRKTEAANILLETNEK